VRLTLEEYEAIRLADYEGLYQEQAAERMNVSRATFGRAIAQARAKIARALVLGLALVIEGEQPPPASDLRMFRCRACGHCWAVAHGTGRPAGCPACGANDFRRTGCAGMDPGGRHGPHNG
jgi:rubrerythrin